MSRRLKLIVAYDGTQFAGWQSQSHRNTIQDHLERAFERVGGERVRVHGAGRTDAGVHALAQCAHVDLANNNLSAVRWTGALNSLLPPTIRVLRCRYVPKDFHARFSAKGKIYRYRIWSAAVLPPLEHGRAWHVAASFDFEVLKAAANYFVGTHDFAGFAANRGKPENNTVRTINSVQVRRNGPCVTIEFDGDGFLYKMVRLIVGSLVRCALGKSPIEEIIDRLASGRSGHARFAAAATGLFLVRVRY
ncbi:MAG TPA: tRNA pseudouridine(38-40) synthase TruA [Spartobacteria bacterium]|jgi:tRNA pseudouridine38-40 synthase|nr:tRNA pseudouridine(38-40) synthase TruA [Spartobacteria bacterium]HCP92304.1 tRNA pseudouridine(38-40) synthase TruA [Spartobacteria bacterium]